MKQTSRQSPHPLSKTMLTTILTLIALPLAIGAWWLLRDLITRSPLDNIPGPQSPSALSGHLERLFHRHNGWKFHNELSDGYAGVAKINGALGKRILYLFDPTALHSVIIKDQQHYEEASISFNNLMLGPGLVSTLHDQHRKQRKMLNPVFSIAHMRHMTPIFYQVAHKLRGGIERQVQRSPGDIDVLNWAGRTALELIGQSGLGYSFDPLVEDAKNEYGDVIKAALPAVFSLGGLIFLAPYVANLGPPAFRRWVLDNLIPDPKIQHFKGIVDYLSAQAKDLIAKKRLALEEGDDAVVQQVGEGKDIMSILLRANMTASDSEKLTEEELLGQMTTLIFAATDTTSGALSQILQLLAQHPDVQERLREEITQAGCGQDISYDQLVDLPYMDAVRRETLRLYPPATDVTRDSTKDMVLPLSKPIRGVDGKYMNELPIPKGTRIIIAIRACNRYKDIWGEDAHEWKPERWLSPLPTSVTDARVPGVYSNMMTFLGGGRSCIGFKFSQLEMKVVLSVLLGSFKFSLSDKEVVWNLAPAKYPTVGKTSMKPSMPMKVELLKNKSS